MKLGVSLYSFHEYARESVYNCIKKAAELSLDGVDFVPVGLEYEDYIPYAKRVGEFTKSLGLEANCFCIGADFINCEDISLEAERVMRYIDIAEAYSCHILRHDITKGFKSLPNNDEAYDRAIEIVTPTIRKITKYAEDKGIITTTENHGYFSQDSQRIERLIKSVNEKNFGALVDIGNFSCADEDNLSAVKRLAPYARSVHAKDFHVKSRNEDNPGEGWFPTRGGNYLRGSILGHGNLPVRECISILKNSGYDGFLSLEFEGMEDPMRGVELGVDKLKKYIGR